MDFTLFFRESAVCRVLPCSRNTLRRVRSAMSHFMHNGHRELRSPSERLKSPQKHDGKLGDNVEYPLEFLWFFLALSSVLP